MSIPTIKANNDEWLHYKKHEAKTKAGLVPCGEIDGEMNYIGTSEEWSRSAELIKELENEL